MYQILLNLLIFFDAIWSVIPSVSSVVTSFRDKVGVIDDTAAGQQNSLKTYKVNKVKKKRKMADTALVVRGKLSAFAFATGNTILLGKLKIPFSKLFYSKDTTAIGNAEIIYSLVEELTPAQKTAAGISDQDILDLREAIDAFKTLPSPIQMRAVRKQLTDLLPVLFKEGNEILKDSMDGLMQQFKFSDTEFYQQWFNARRLLETHRHTTIEVETFDETTGEDLSNVQVIISSDEETFEEMTDIQGFAKQQVSPEISYKVKFILPEYDEKEIDGVNLDRGKHQRFIVKLKKSNA